MNNNSTITITWQFVQGIQEDIHGEYEDLGICGFDFDKKDKNIGHISLLKILIHLCTSRWKNSWVKYKLRSGWIEILRCHFLFLYLLTFFFLMYTTDYFFSVSFPSHINRIREYKRENLINPVSDFEFCTFFGIIMADYTIYNEDKKLWD